MADVEFDSFDGDFDTSNGMAARSARLVGIAGAVTSIALILGLAYWGYRLAVRDMTGIPVVRAMEGPMRMAPENPGGVIASNQGLSVNAVAEDGGLFTPAERLTLAPAPVDLSEEDAIGTAVAMVAPVSGRGANMPGLGFAPMPEAAEEPAMMQNANLDIVEIDAMAEGSVPLAADLDITLKTESTPVFKLPKGALAQSPRPRARPAGAVVTASAPVTASSEDNAEITGDDLASGTRLVQLGAFDSEEVARKEWVRLSGRFGDLLADKTRIVQAAQSGGRTFYRLRAMGFTDESDSRRFCSALVAERAACIPVAVR